MSPHMRSILSISVLLSSVLFSQWAISESRENTIFVGADSWCPYNCVPNSDSPGYLIEVLEHAFEEKGYKIVYRLYPWQRALALAEKGVIDAVVGAVEGNHAGNLIGKQSLGRDETVFVVRKGEDFSFRGVSQLESKVLGVIADYTYDNNGILDSYLATRHIGRNDIYLITQDNPLTQLFGMLKLGRIDAFPENKYVATYNAIQNKSINDVSFVLTGTGNEVYVAFSPNDRGKNLLSLFDTMVGKIKKDGTLFRIAKKYGIKLE